jgi:hypothetical protein
MKDGSTDSQCISRRLVLTSSVLAFGAAATTAPISQAQTQQKISQEDAKYQDTPKGAQQCDGCINFQPPNACKFVEGEIKPDGWCQLFYPKT